ncbi:hypothetical protein ACQ4M4_05190 [Leptolyngbya sp. AN02str]|uniref:hypothetical protein n=1 Tax=Leptolyngbya sp. AN02str TaxID=3423363 RepID=UPI003D318E39
MTEAPLYRRLSTCSRRAIARTHKRFGHPYIYRPRGNLLQRLSRETGMTVDQVYRQLLREREELIRSRI